VSIDRTKQLLSCLKIPISTGAIQNMMDKAAAVAVAPVERIKDKVIRMLQDREGCRAICARTEFHLNSGASWQHFF